jgi:copper chaperone NosL
MTATHVLVLAFALLFAACADGPRDIAVGEEECAHCRMRVSEEHFASQLRSQQGRVYVFDSIECMAEYVEQAVGLEYRGLWVTDFTRPGRWVEVGEAHFLQSPGIRSPMGMNLTAFATQADARLHQDEHGGEIHDWSSVIELVSQRRVAGGALGHAH